MAANSKAFIDTRHFHQLKASRMAGIERRVVYPWFNRFESLNSGVLRLMASFTILVWIGSASLILYAIWFLTFDPNPDVASCKCVARLRRFSACGNFHPANPSVHCQFLFMDL